MPLFLDESPEKSGALVPVVTGRGHMAVLLCCLAVALSACVGSGPVAALGETDTSLSATEEVAPDLPPLPSADAEGNAVPEADASGQNGGQQSAGIIVPTRAPRTTNPAAAQAPAPGQGDIATAPSALAAATQSPSPVPAKNVIEQNLSTPSSQGASETPSPTPASNSKDVVVTTNSETATSQPLQSETVSQASLEDRLGPQKPVVRKRKRTIQRSGRGADENGSVAPVRTARLETRARSQAQKPERKKPQLVLRSRSKSSDQAALPGVKSNDELFGIRQENKAKPKSNAGKTQVAALGSLGRVSPNGLRLQHKNVNVSCLKQGVLQIIKQVERRYGKKPIITSAYRSPKRNRRVGGARNSTHIRCMAVDIQVEGVSKWQLAKYLRSIPGRGGVGTYCRTKSVHVDIGKKRDWHHKCRRSKAKKRRKA